MKGICFTEPLFYAAVNGTKTQTRRIIKPQPQGCFVPIGQNTYQDGHYTNFKPKYQVGEKVYLKEPYRVHNCIYSYLAQDGKNICFAYTSMCNLDSCTVNLEFKTKKNMPQCYAQHFIEITAVRCERLQDISDEDCLKEGIQEQQWIDGADRDIFYVVRNMDCELCNTPQQAYAALIDKISGKGTFESNPYVWVYDFKLVKY